MSKQPKPQLQPQQKNQALKQKSEELKLSFVNEQVNIVFDKKSGWLTQYQYLGQTLLQSPLKANFWRAPTDNDLGNGMQKWASIWQFAADSLNLNSIGSTKTENGFNVETFYSSQHFKGQYSVIYQLNNNGQIHVESKLNILSGQKLPNLPRLGMQLIMQGEYQTLSWFGRGPHESYADRKTSTQVSLYKSKVSDQIHHYSRPQENANKTDVRWFALKNTERGGLLIVGDELLNASAWPYLQSDIDFIAGKDGAESASGLVPVTSKHGSDVPMRDLVTVNIDFKQMGVGGDTSWGRLVHAQYTVPAQTYQYGFTLQPFTSKMLNKDIVISELARSINNK